VARLTVLTPNQLPNELREQAGVDDSTQLGSLGVWALQPEIASALLELKAVLGSQSLTPRLSELVRLRVAFHNQCRSCMSLRSAEAIDDGLTEALVCELRSPEESDDLTQRERAALEYADKLSIAHHDIDDALFARLEEHFTEEEIVELGAHIGFCIGFGRVAMSWDLVDDLPDGLREPGVVGPWDAAGGVVRPR
jgi:AhpD family alkylhydroperoxidase